MPKFRVILPFTERIIEAEDEYKADELFRDDETIFYALETQRMEDHDPHNCSVCEDQGISQEGN